MRPARGVILVRKVQTEETMPGGTIIIPDEARERIASHQVQIIAVGEPEECTAEFCSRVHEQTVLNGEKTIRTHVVSERLRENAWAIVQPRSFAAADPNQQDLFFIRHDDVLGVFWHNV